MFYKIFYFNEDVKLKYSLIIYIITKLNNKIMNKRTKIKNKKNFDVAFKFANKCGFWHLF